MRCPKCGYNSFDHLDNCKKCSKDLTEHKAKFNIQSVLLSEAPLESTSLVAEEAVAAATVAPAAPDVTSEDFTDGVDSADSDDFGFDFMADTEDDENLAFDELFEEVSGEDGVEESLPAPEETAAETAEEPAPFDLETAEEPAPLNMETAEEPVPLDQELTAEEPSGQPEAAATGDFSFDAEEPLEAAEKPSDAAKESPAEFGFDDDSDADIFAETEEDFSLDGSGLEDQDKK